MQPYTETDYEHSLIELFRDTLGYDYVYGPDVERDFHSPLFHAVLEDSLYRINVGLSQEAIQEALSKLQHFENAELLQKNTLFMDYLQNGIEVQYFDQGQRRSAIVYLADYDNPARNSFIIANQWTYIENSTKRPDMLLFLNGLPIVLIELKSPSREETDASEAYRQIRNYMKEVPSLFIYNAICVMSDQLTSKAGTITSGEDRFMEWKTKDGNYENTQYAQFDTFFEGMFKKNGFWISSKTSFASRMRDSRALKSLQGIINTLPCGKPSFQRKKLLRPTEKPECFGIRREAENLSRWCFMPIYCKLHWKALPL